MEQLFNPYDGKPETELDRLCREHTEAWAPIIKPKMDAAKSWAEVKELYATHNLEIARLKWDYENKGLPNMKNTICPSCEKQALFELPEDEKLRLSPQDFPDVPEDFQFNIKCSECGWIGDEKQLKG